MLRAREVHTDAQAALAALDESSDETMRRVFWVSAISLLRAALHVLEKVDAAAHPHLVEPMQAEWKVLCSTRPKPDIFWGFIDDARNMTLKRYDFVADLGTSNLVTAGGECVVTNDGSKVVAGDFFKIYDGPFKGRDASEILTEASQWVSNYIGKFE